MDKEKRLNEIIWLAAGEDAQNIVDFWNDFWDDEDEEDDEE